MVILLSYDLNGHERPSTYEDVKEMIDRYAISTKKPLYSQWLIETEDTVQTWSDRMKAVTDEDDYWLIIKVQRPYQGWLPKAVWDWLDGRI